MAANVSQQNPVATPRAVEAPVQETNSKKGIEYFGGNFLGNYNVTKKLWNDGGIISKIGAVAVSVLETLLNVLRTVLNTGVFAINKTVQLFSKDEKENKAEQTQGTSEQTEQPVITPTEGEEANVAQANQVENEAQVNETQTGEGAEGTVALPSTESTTAEEAADVADASEDQAFPVEPNRFRQGAEKVLNFLGTQARPSTGSPVAGSVITMAPTALTAWATAGFTGATLVSGGIATGLAGLAGAAGYYYAGQKAAAPAVDAEEAPLVDAEESEEATVATPVVEAEESEEAAVATPVVEAEESEEAAVATPVVEAEQAASEAEAQSA